MTMMQPSYGDHEHSRVVITSRPHHVAIYGRSYLIATCGAVCLVNWLRLVIEQSGWASAALVLALGVCGWAAISLFWSYMKHRGLRVLVTTLAAIRRRKRWLSTKEQQIPLSHVFDVEVSQRPLGTLFGFGDVVIYAGEHSAEWRDIADPYRVAEEILAHSNHEHREPPTGDCPSR